VSDSEQKFAWLQKEQENATNAQVNLQVAKEAFFAEFDWPPGTQLMHNWWIDYKTDITWYSTPISIVFFVGRMRCEFDKKDVFVSRDEKFIIIPSTRVEWLYVLRVANGLTVELNQV
jgi:hypothetical protein